MWSGRLWLPSVVCLAFLEAGVSLLVLSRCMHHLVSCITPPWRVCVPVSGHLRVGVAADGYLAQRLGAGAGSNSPRGPRSQVLTVDGYVCRLCASRPGDFRARCIKPLYACVPFRVYLFLGFLTTICSDNLLRLSENVSSFVFLFVAVALMSTFVPSASKTKLNQGCAFVVSWLSCAMTSVVIRTRAVLLRCCFRSFSPCVCVCV